MPAYTTFPPWKHLLSKSNSMLKNAFDKQPLGANPAFLYSSITAPLPSAQMSGFWDAYPSIQGVAAHLRFGLLPLEFSIWLCRDEWDPAPREPKTAETIFEGAIAANIRYCEDIPLMRSIIAELDIAMKATKPSAAVAGVQKAADMFNERWQSTHTWDFFHKPLPNKTALLKHIKSKGYIQEGDTKALVKLLRGSLQDEKHQRQLRELLKDFLVY